METKRVILFPEDVSKETGLGLNTIYRLLKSGALKSQKAGDRWIISRANLEAWANGTQNKAA